MIKNSNNEWRQHREHDVIETQGPTLKNNLPTEAILKTVPELRHEKGDVLVERVEDDFGNALVGPGTVDEEEFAEVFELGDGNVGGTSSLKTFDTGDTDTDVSSLNHGDIVCAVTDGEEDGFKVAFYKLDDESFLKGRYTAFQVLAGRKEGAD